jgi:hypothetical protein
MLGKFRRLIPLLHAVGVWGEDANLFPASALSRRWLLRRTPRDHEIEYDSERGHARFDAAVPGGPGGHSEADRGRFRGGYRSRREHRRHHRDGAWSGTGDDRRRGGRHADRDRRAGAVLGQWNRQRSRGGAGVGRRDANAGLRFPVFLDGLRVDADEPGKRWRRAGPRCSMQVLRRSTRSSIRSTW